MLKVYMQWADYANSLEVAIVDEREDGSSRSVKPVELEFEDVQEGEYIKPAFVLRHRMAKSFMGAMAEVLDKQGVKTDKDAKIEGTLDATRYHLEDLRKLLKLKA